MRRIDITTIYNDGFFRLPQPQITISARDRLDLTYSCIFDEGAFHLPEIFNGKTKLITTAAIGTPRFFERFSRIPKTHEYRFKGAPLLQVTKEDLYEVSTSRIKAVNKEKLRKQKPYDYRTNINGISFSYPRKPSNILCEWENGDLDFVLPYALSITAALLWKYYKFGQT